jgi:hypothetical protein
VATSQFDHEKSNKQAITLTTCSSSAIKTKANANLEHASKQMTPADWLQQRAQSFQQCSQEVEQDLNACWGTGHGKPYQHLEKEKNAVIFVP